MEKQSSTNAGVALRAFIFVWLLLKFGTTPANSQQSTPGSPEATTTITGKQLPPPDRKFGGMIKEKASESTPWWPPRIVPPKALGQARDGNP